MSRLEVPGRRELIFIALIVILGASAGAMLINARVKLQGLGNMLQGYHTASVSIARNVNRMLDANAEGTLDPSFADFLKLRIDEQVVQARKFSGLARHRLIELSGPVSRRLSNISKADLNVIGNDDDARKLLGYAESIIKSDTASLPGLLNSIDADLATAVKYGDALDELRYRVELVSELAVRSSQPLLLLLIAIVISVLLGILAVWLRALKPAIAQLQMSNVALEDAGVALKDQNLAFVRREVESQAAQRVAKFGYWIVDDTGQLRRSEGLPNILSMKPSELPNSLQQMARIGRPGMHLGQMTKDDVLAGYMELSRRDGAREFTREVDGPNGEERIIRERVESFVEEQTGARYMIGIMIDVSELAQAQARIARADKLDSIAVLTGFIAHDVNNVLAVIRGSMDLLELSPETIRARLGAMRRAVDSATGLINRLSLISKGEMEGPDVFDPGMSLAECVSFFKVNDIATIRVDLDVQADGIQCVRLNRGQFENAILNILINSREALDGRTDGTISVSSRLVKDPKIESRDGHKVSGTFVRIEITDNGGGMSPQALRRVFDPFFSTKVHDSSRPRGLGLWSVYQFISNSNGELTISSKEGQGTTITIYLPHHVVKTPGNRNEKLPVPNAAQRFDANILIVDDEEDLLFVLSEQLKILGYRIWKATNLTEAYKILSDTPEISAIVSDVNLRRGETGLQLAAHVRSTYQDKAIVFISGFLSTARARGELGDIVVVRKPIDLDVLDAEIQRAIGHTQARPKGEQPT